MGGEFKLGYICDGRFLLQIVRLIVRVSFLDQPQPNYLSGCFCATISELNHFCISSHTNTMHPDLPHILIFELSQIEIFFLVQMFTPAV